MTKWYIIRQKSKKYDKNNALSNCQKLENIFVRAIDFYKLP
jgi:hypothetical protein